MQIGVAVTFIGRRIIPAACALYDQRYAALLRIFDCIRKYICYDLLDPYLITVED